jgi:hypothetical protein
LYILINPTRTRIFSFPWESRRKRVLSIKKKKKKGEEFIVPLCCLKTRTDRDRDRDRELLGIYFLVAQDIARTTVAF